MATAILLNDPDKAGWFGCDPASRPRKAKKTTSYFSQAIAADMGAEVSKLEPEPEHPMEAALRRNGSERERKRKLEGGAKNGTVAKRLKPTATDGPKARARVTKALTQTTKTKASGTKASKVARQIATKTTRRGAANKTAIARQETPPTPADREPAIPETPNASKRQLSGSSLVSAEDTFSFRQASSQKLVVEAKRPNFDEHENVEIAKSVTGDVEVGPDGDRPETGGTEPANEEVNAVDMLDAAGPSTNTNGGNASVAVLQPMGHEEAAIENVNAADTPAAAGLVTARNDNVPPPSAPQIEVTHETLTQTQESGPVDRVSDPAPPFDTTPSSSTPAMPMEAEVSLQNQQPILAEDSLYQDDTSEQTHSVEEVSAVATTTTAAGQEIYNPNNDILVLKVPTEGLMEILSKPKQATTLPEAAVDVTTTYSALEDSITARPKRMAKAPDRYEGIVEHPSEAELLDGETVPAVQIDPGRVEDEQPETPSRPSKRARLATASTSKAASAAKGTKASKSRKRPIAKDVEAPLSQGSKADHNLAASPRKVAAPPAKAARRSSVASTRRTKGSAAKNASTYPPSEEERDASFAVSAVSDDADASDFETPPRKKTTQRRRPSTVSAPRRPRLQTPSTATRQPTKSKQAVTSSLLTPPSSQLGDTTLLETVDPDVLALSRTLTQREPVGKKPLPVGEPRAWADSRQALCETVPYFKKPQGGCHSNEGHVYSFLFDSVGHCREYMDSELIISRAGGGMEQDSNGNMVQGKDQSMNEAQVKAMLNNIQLQNPLIVICGNKNTGSICAMPHKYCVLGWYKPTAVWAEKTTGKGKKAWVTMKYRMEWMTGQGKPWHAPKDGNGSASHAEPAMRRDCYGCQQTSPQVYLEGWLCLNADCADFWKLPNREDAPTGRLAYNPAFLYERTSWACEDVPFSVRPALPDIGKALGDSRLYINTRGVVCPDCGKCNQRYLWKGWRCDNPVCSWQGLELKQDPILPASLHKPWEIVGDGPSLSRSRHDNNVKVSISYAYGYKIYTYEFMGVDGRLIHAISNKQISAEKDGPDHMLREMQMADMGLERRRFGVEKMSGGKVTASATTIEAPKTPPRNTTLDGQLLTPLSEPALSIAPTTEDTAENSQGAVETSPVEDGDFMTAFSMNFGMPYKFVASGASRSFEDAPWPVRACRSRLNWAAKEFLPRDAVDTNITDFNEELIFAYMEGQKIEYHDDGEEGLGQRIATLSLGGKAQMSLRMKAKHFNGCSKTGVLNEDRPLPGSTEYERRTKVLRDLEQLKTTDKLAYKRRLKEIPKELGLYEKRNKLAKDLVTITLSHGDIVLMDGYEIQKFLEHKVVSSDCLRFALTCRTVQENHLKDHEKPAYDVRPDNSPYQPSTAR